MIKDLFVASNSFLFKLGWSEKLIYDKFIFLRRMLVAGAMAMLLIQIWFGCNQFHYAYFNVGQLYIVFVIFSSAAVLFCFL